VPLAPSGAVFVNYGTTVQISSTLNTTQTNSFAIGLATLDATTLRPVGSALWQRPGANLKIAVSSSDGKMVAVAPASLSSGDTELANVPSGVSSQQTLTLIPQGPGAAIVSLAPLPGGVTASAGRLMVVNVTDPDLVISPFSIGRNLAAPVQMRLGSNMPTPTSALSVNISANYPLGLQTAAGGLAVHSTTATIPAGQRVSSQVWVQARATGSAQLSLSYGGAMGQ